MLGVGQLDVGVIFASPGDITESCELLHRILGLEETGQNSDV